MPDKSQSIIEKSIKDDNELSRSLSLKGGTNFLFIRLSAIGDVVRTLPALALLRNRFPDARITWLVEEKAFDILSQRGDIDEVILFPRRSITEKIKSPITFFGAFSEFISFIRHFRSKRFDVTLDFHGILKSGILSYLSGAPLRIGFDKGFSKEMNHIFSNRRVGLNPPRLSRVERNLVLARSIVGELDVPDIAIEVTPEDVFSVDSIEKQSLKGRRPRIIIHPGTSPDTPYKRWEAKGYGAVADMLIARTGGEVIITYGPGEEKMAFEVLDCMEHTAVILESELEIRELAELYRRSDVYIGGDTGPMHIASFVGTPVVAVFGPTDPIENEPYNRTPYRMVRRPVSCSPCRDRGCIKGLCFESITPEMVANSALELLVDMAGGEVMER